MKYKIGIVNIGVNNLKSVLSFFLKFGDVKIIETNKNNNSLKNIDLLILPGNGSFAYGSEFLVKNNLIDEIKNFQNKIIGICLGMQLLFQESEESPNFKGIGMINGTVKKINSKKFKLPLLGWYSCVDHQNKKYNYFFNNSFICNPLDKSIINQKIDTNIELLPSCIKFKNIYGLQFHPEKSSKNGYNLITDILNE